jgi:hypothetical protein
MHAMKAQIIKDGSFNVQKMFINELENGGDKVTNTEQYDVL